MSLQNEGNALFVFFPVISIFCCQLFRLDNSVAIGFFVNFGEISYLFINKVNKNDLEPSEIINGNYIEKVVIDKNVSLK
jgi:hypothetical protein